MQENLLRVISKIRIIEIECMSILLAENTQDGRYGIKIKCRFSQLFMFRKQA